MRQPYIDNPNASLDYDTLDLHYLRLDCFNDPLTQPLEIYVTDYGTMPPHANFVAQYKLNDDLADTVVIEEQGTNGTASRNTNLLSSDSAKLFKCFNFVASSDDYFDCNQTFQTTFQDSFSIAFWFRANDGQPSDYQFLCGSCYQDGTSHQVEDMVQIGITDGGAIYIQLNCDWVDVLPFKWIVGQTADGVLSDGDTGWKFMVVVFDNVARQIYLYLDNVLIPFLAIENFNGAYPVDLDMSQYDAHGYNFFVGARNYNNNGVISYSFDGKIDNFCLFNIALSADEMSTLYNYGTGTERNQPTIDFLKVGSNLTSMTFGEVDLGAGIGKLPYLSASSTTPILGTNIIALPNYLYVLGGNGGVLGTAKVAWIDAETPTASNIELQADGSLLCYAEFALNGDSHLWFNNTSSYIYHDSGTTALHIVDDTALYLDCNTVLSTGYSLFFRDATLYITSTDDGYLDIYTDMATRIHDDATNDYPQLFINTFFNIQTLDEFSAVDYAIINFNAYFDGSTSRYIEDGRASRIWFDKSATYFRLDVRGAGNAGDPISWVQAITVTGTEFSWNSGEIDWNFRIASADYTNMFFMDAGLNRIGICTGSPLETLSIYTDDAGGTEGCIGLYNYNADVYPNRIKFCKFSPSPADDDYSGIIDFYGYNDALESIRYFQIQCQTEDVSDGTEAGYLGFNGYFNGASVGFCKFDGYDTVAGTGKIEFNEGQNDINFIINSASDKIFFMDAGDHRIGLGTATPSCFLEVNGATLFDSDVTMGAGTCLYFEDTSSYINLNGTNLQLYDDDHFDMLTDMVLASDKSFTYTDTSGHFDYIYSFNGVATYTDLTSIFTMPKGLTTQTFLATSAYKLFIGKSTTFSSIYIDLSRFATNLTLTFQYSQGGGNWGTLTVTDNSSNLTVNGSIDFTPPVDWATDTVNGATAYWVKLGSSTSSNPDAWGYYITPVATDPFDFKMSDLDVSTMKIHRDGSVHISNLYFDGSAQENEEGNTLQVAGGAGRLYSQLNIRPVGTRNMLMDLRGIGTGYGAEYRAVSGTSTNICTIWGVGANAYLSFGGSTGKFEWNANGADVNFELNTVNILPFFFIEASTGSEAVGINVGTTPTAGATLHVGGNVIIGKGTDGADYTLTFDGNAGDFVFTWMEDELYLNLSQSIYMADNAIIKTNNNVGLEFQQGEAVWAFKYLDSVLANSGVYFNWGSGTIEFRYTNTPSFTHNVTNGNTTIGNGGDDVTLTFDGSADGTIKWWEDETNFQMSNNLIVDDDITCDYIKTDGNEYLATDIVRHTITAGEAGAGTFSVAWAKATQAKVADMHAVYLALTPDPDEVWADDWASGYDQGVHYNGTNIIVNQLATAWVENDIITVTIHYEK